MTVLLFDVMSTLVHDPFATEMPAFFGMSFDEMLKAKHPHAWIDFERGALSEAEFLARFFADGRSFDGEGFVRCVAASYRFLPGIEALLQELASRGVPMHTLSNYPCWYRRVEARVRLSRYVAWTNVSCETGLRKPDPEAYLDAARRVAAPPAQCLFVDDRESNCEAARAVGMRALRFEGAEPLREALRGEGLLP